MSIEIERYSREYRLKTEMRLPQTREEVFPFFADAKNLEILTPDILRFRIVTPLPITMEKGALIHYKIRINYIPVSWTTLISAWDPPYRFVDEQLQGPYRYWIHEHTFESDGEESIVRDEVRYQVLGGEIPHSLFVRNDLLKIFNYRQEKLRELFPARSKSPEPAPHPI